MDRLPFDPAQTARRAPPEVRLTVTQLCERIDVALRASLPGRVRVIGEISGFSDRTHWYFDLKDAASLVNCVMFSSAARRSAFRPENGREVVASGRVELYARQGRLSLIVDRIEPVGAGALELAYRALCQELRALGWFDPARKRPVPRFPRKIAIITSRTGAALQDVLDTMRRRCPAVHIALIDVRVQGDGAAADIAAALRWIAARHGDFAVDAILLTRGGGSIDDLWTFNDRAVAHAILDSPLPVVAAIGHETDITIAELVADERCATPTQAAMRLTPDAAALSEQLDLAAARLRSGIQRLLRDAAARHQHALRLLRTHPIAVIRHLGLRVERLAARLDAYRPARLHARRHAELHRAEARLHAAIRLRLPSDLPGRLARSLDRAWSIRAAGDAARLASLERQLNAVGPVAVLRRGFSATFREDGALVRAPSDVRTGDLITTRVAEGQFTSTVGPPPGPVPQPARRPRPPHAPPDQMDLFGRPR